MSELHGLLVGSSPNMLAFKKKVKQVAQNGAVLNVMLIAASGTGKELTARIIHERGPLDDRPFMALDCSSLSEQLLESALFGHKKGAFDGAKTDSAGLIGTIDTDHTTPFYEKEGPAGTLFLDELHQLPPATQGRLLRFFESGEYRRVGEIDVRYAKVRAIAALPPGDAQRASLRDDLYSLLAEVEIRIPELNERRGDIPDIAKNLLWRLSSSQPDHVENRVDENKIAQILDNDDYIRSLVNHDWSRGNVRELYGALKRAAFLGEFSLPDRESAESLEPSSDSVRVLLPANLDKLPSLEGIKATYVREADAALKKQKPGIKQEEIYRTLDINYRTYVKYLGDKHSQ